MSIDDLLTSHPVYIPVTHPDEINEIFDLISYAKVIYHLLILKVSHFSLLFWLGSSVKEKNFLEQSSRLRVDPIAKALRPLAGEGGRGRVGKQEVTLVASPCRRKKNKGVPICFQCNYDVFRRSVYARNCHF